MGSPIPYTYNANGEQTGRVVGGVAYTLAYDDEGQLTGVTSSGSTVDYAYDATGRRVSRTAGGTGTQFVYGLGGILQERQGSTWTAAYTYGNALLRRNSEVPLYDALGSERTVTDGSGSVTGSIAYEAFGQPVATSGSSAIPYTFAATSGYRNDGDAGLTHVGARYYDAQVGRFISRDTELDQHPYLYCDHDPVNAVDPSGHFVMKITWFHCWIEYPGGSVGFWPGSDSPWWGPGKIQSPDPYGGKFGIPIGWVPWSRADAVIGEIAAGAQAGNNPGGGFQGGIYQFPFCCCVQGAQAMAAYAVDEAGIGVVRDVGRAVIRWFRRTF